MPPHGAAYSINRGLWGVTIGGRETLTSAGSIPEAAWVLSRGAFDQPRGRAGTRSGSSAASRARSTARRSTRSRSSRRLDAVAAPFGIGRGIHLGDTIIGIKGRVAFEAPAAAVLIVAHRELEKLVLGQRQQRIKDLVAAAYGDLVHEGQFLDPVCRDIEALFASSQERVTGDVRRAAAPGLGVRRGRAVAAFAEGRLARASTAKRPANGPRRMRAASRGSLALPGVCCTPAGRQRTGTS